MAKILMLLIGLLFIGLGVRAILTRRANIGFHFGDGEPVDSDGEPVGGWAAILIGVLGIVAGLSIIDRFVF
ncbi:hypothetical protein J5226_04330 [Lysobacter sp. K5869]|uniref:hypothetical protein n=1 Tax=Lysobacter sp. K5869 TaxID=2820808 RepID=UPI001C0626A1|nr:hypothetical protein [Lysobacter sp. K5869]QWP77645.1 hypothetical protein J5226_04330 [Lysobacter sp. K5869]